VELDRVRDLLDRLGIPAEGFSVLGIGPGAGGGLEVHLSWPAFWRAVKRLGAEVRSEAREDLLFPYRHRLVLEGVECFTYSREAVLPPGTVTPGYALCLT